MRIVAGKFKGKTLVEFLCENTRPTSDMARSAIFNVIFDKIVNCNFLDIFGGTGAIGIEAESRGAKKVVVIDNNSNSIKNIQQNCKKCGTENVKFILDDFALALKNLGKQKEKFDIVYVDPPYASNYGEISLQLLINYNLLNIDSIVIFEHDKSKNMNNINYEIIKQKKYGIAYVDFLSLKENGIE